jgi:quercetin dioxygenase-like cupin family protein
VAEEREFIMSIKHSNEVEAKNVAAGKDTTIQVLISSQEGPNFALRKFSMQRGGGMPRHTIHSYQNIGAEPFEFLCIIPNKEDKITIVDESC